MLPAEENEDEPSTDLREAECAADSLEERRAALAAAAAEREAAAVQSADKRGLRSRAEGHAVCAGWRLHRPPAAGPVCRVACQASGHGDLID